MEQRVGSCSLCGDDVRGFRGAWMATVPPPPDKCVGCGAVAGNDVIQMRKPGTKGISTEPGFDSLLCKV